MSLINMIQAKQKIADNTRKLEAEKVKAEALKDAPKPKPAPKKKAVAKEETEE